MLILQFQVFDKQNKKARKTAYNYLIRCEYTVKDFKKQHKFYISFGIEKFSLFLV